VVGKANNWINVEKIIGLNNSKLKVKKKKKKRQTQQTCKSPMQRQRFITAIKNVTEGEKKAQKPN